jgi:hypothetical protein
VTELRIKASDKEWGRKSTSSSQGNRKEKIFEMAMTIDFKRVEDGTLDGTWRRS